jgi:glycosyltransferase involved in cell wall biosynthesis
MNILVINHYAGSQRLGMEYRPYYLSREWEKQGHHTTIVTASFSHIRTQNPEIKNKYCFIDIEGIEYLFIRTPKYTSNSWKRFINILVFVIRLFMLSNMIVKKRKYDVVIASSTYPLDIFPARRIAVKSKAKLIYEVHDLWPLSPMELGGYSKWHPFIMLMQHAENFAYKKSDKVVSLLPKTKEHMMAHGLNEEKWSYIPNGINQDDWENFENIPGEISSQFLKIRKKYSRIVAYTGTFGLANALDSFVDAAKLLRDIPVAFVLFGKGPLASHLKEKIEKEFLDNVYIFGNVSKSSIPHLLSLVDFVFIGSPNQPLYRFGVSPNKLMDYMMAGKPVIQAIKAGNDMVQDAGCGVSVEPENPAAIAEAVRTMFGMSEEELNVLGNKGKEYILLFYLYDNLAKKFIDIINNN